MATDREIREAGFKYIPPQEFLLNPFKIPTLGSPEINQPPPNETGILATDAFNNSDNIFNYDDRIGAPGASPFLNMSQADFNKQLFETGPYANPYGQTLADYNRNPAIDPLNQKIVEKLREDRNNNKYTDEELISMYGNQNFKGGMFENEDEEFNLMDYAPFIGDKSIFQGIMGALPQQDPRFTDIRSYYGGEDNLDSTGRIKSGLMAGYSPVSGGFLNTITGGRFGEAPTYGLQRAYQKRIDTINKTLARKRARGLSEKSIQYKHALRNGLIPVITIAGINIGTLVAFSIITETVFQWPGMGFLFIQAVKFVDIPIMSAYLVFIAFIFVMINFIVDILYYFIDPRIRVKSGDANG